MGWPYDGGLWRDGARPAQEQYANVAKAISEFEPLIMLADPQVISQPWFPVYPLIYRPLTPYDRLYPRPPDFCCRIEY